MERQNSDMFAWEKDIYVQDKFSERSAETEYSATFDDSTDDDQENICPNTGRNMAKSWRTSHPTYPGVPLQDITHLFKKPVSKLEIVDSPENRRKLKNLRRTFR